METSTSQTFPDEVKQIKIIPPGCQFKFNRTISVNENYFCYSATMTISVFYRESMKLKCILNPNIEQFVKCLALNTGNTHELAAFYDSEILIFNLVEEKIVDKYSCNEVVFMEFNSDNKLLFVTVRNELFFLELGKKGSTQVKTVGKVTFAKWYPFNNTDLAYSALDHQISYQNITMKNRISSVSLDIREQNNQIADLSWYTVDENYKFILAGLATGSVYLLDFSDKLASIVIKFEKYGNGIVSLIWLKFEPGTFISITKGTGKVAWWNVSKKNYNEVTKFSDSPILHCVAFPESEKVFLSLENGSVAVYDLKHRKNAFLLSPGHSESIFDLKFSPLNYGLFATCSFDSTIKVWDICTNKVVCNLTVNFMKSTLDKITDEEKIHVLCIKWSNTEKDYLASGDTKGSLRIWDISKQKQLTSVRLITANDAQIIGMDWDDKNNFVAGCLSIVYLAKFENGKLTQTKSIKVGCYMFQIKFSPLEKETFAIACFDGGIKFFNEANEKPLKVLTGHSKKVFGIAFNKAKNLLASTSDDYRVGVWDLERNTGQFLVGHTNNSRQAVWVPDCPNLLITGSWDGTIRVWNVEWMICISLISEHHSDVYGLDISPHHPFLFLSSSRDNSIRFWNLAQAKSIDCFLNFQVIRNFFDYYILESKIKGVMLDDITKAEIISGYFYYNDGLKDFWDILRVVTKRKEYSDVNNKVFYVSDLYSAYKSKTEQLEFNYFSKTKFDYSVKREDMLKEAIDYCAKCGNWEKFCELSVELGDWHNALMAAPHVSLSYWKKLTHQYAEFCQKNKGEDEKIFSSLLSNELQPCLTNFVDSGDYEDAKLIWLTRGNAKFPFDYSSSLQYQTNSCFSLTDDVLSSVDKQLDNLSFKDELFKITCKIARDHLSNGYPILAACAFLSIKDLGGALKTLVRSFELEIGYMVMTILNDFTYEEDILMGLLVKQIKKGSVERAVNVINVSTKPYVKFILLKFLNFFYPLSDDLAQEMNKIAESCSNDEVLQAVSQNDWDFILKQFYEKSEELAHDLSNNRVKTPTVEDLIRLMFYMKGMNCTLITSDFEKFYVRILTTCSAIEALNYNLKSCGYLFTELYSILKKPSVALDSTDKLLVGFSGSVVKGENIKTEEISTDYHKDIKDQMGTVKNYNSILDMFKAKRGSFPLKYHCDDLGYFYCIREEIFPVSAKGVSNSTLTGKMIKGKVVQCGSYVLSSSQALEWFKMIPKGFQDNKKPFIPY